MSATEEEEERRPKGPAWRRGELYETHQSRRERAVLIAVKLPGTSQQTQQDNLDELAFLAETAGAECVARFQQTLAAPDARSYLGSGKIDEIASWLTLDGDVDLVISDDELSPAQQKALEEAWKVRVLDRTSLILDIFAARARTAHAKTQVQLAQYRYLLPRLTRLWTHLDRQKGGIGMRGTGEKQIETDRRIILQRIALLDEELQHIDRQMRTQRQNRGRLIRVALVGYTNVGKSTLMNTLAKTEVLAENKLFATLDTTVRKVVIDNLPFLLSDTVGFIRKLPTHLVESFKSTLDEVREADLLLHVVDISHPAFEQQITVVDKTIEELGAATTPQMLIFNKTDAFRYSPQAPDDLTPAERGNRSLDDLRHSWMTQGDRQCVFVSAKTRHNLEELRSSVYQRVKELHVKRFPYNDFLY